MAPQRRPYKCTATCWRHMEIALLESRFPWIAMNIRSWMHFNSTRYNQTTFKMEARKAEFETTSTEINYNKLIIILQQMQFKWINESADYVAMKNKFGLVLLCIEVKISISAVTLYSVNIKYVHLLYWSSSWPPGSKIHIANPTQTRPERINNPT